MKKLFMTFAAVVITGSLFAGGLVTNTNQSALFTRLQSRNASTTIDAVYFNPAGLTKLNDGFHLGLNNQTIGQTRSITTTYPFLSGSPKEFVGTVSAPIFPSVYAAYKTGKFAFSFGFNPIGGGGGATYENGLPSFEMMAAELVPLLSSQGFPTTQYAADIFFEGASIYFGYQANVSYKINDQFSVAAGMRMVTASNSYNGHLKDISVNPNYPAFGSQYTGGMVLASDFFTSGATTLTTLAAGATSYIAGLAPIISGGGGAVLVSNGTSVGLSAAQVTQIQQILGAAGLTPAQIGATTIAGASATFTVAAPTFTAGATQMTGYAGATADANVDAEKTGTGYSPIISFNYSPSDKLNIAVKYEFQTKLELTTKVEPGMGGGIFFNDSTEIADMPALLAVGVEFKPMDNLLVSGSFNYYFDKGVDYDGKEWLDINKIDKNFMEIGLGAQYSLTDKFMVSAGWLKTITGVNDAYQSDLTHSLNTNSVGGGFGYKISPMISMNLGGSYTMYQEGSLDYSRGVLGTATDVYNRNAWVVALGLDFAF